MNTETTNPTTTTPTPKAKRVKKRTPIKAKAKKLTTPKKTVSTKMKTVKVPVKEYTILATQDTTVTKVGKNTTKTAGPVRFALMKGNDLVATTGNKKLNVEKFNKSFVKTVAPSVLPVVKKLQKTGELNL